MKDRFSIQAEAYARFRPVYPKELYDYMFERVSQPCRAWDAGTGNGQVAQVLARYFDEVHATDISEAQLSKAPEVSNVHYTVQSAEAATFPDAFFNLIVVAQAIHWFDFDAFYTQVQRCAAPGALLVVMGYGNVHTEGPVQEVLSEFYSQTVGPYWDAERRYIDEGYKTIPFPWDSMEVPDFSINCSWNQDALLGYLSSWSAVQRYTQILGHSPLPAVVENLNACWGTQELKSFEFPVLLKVARVR